jgi:hypothetical protein
MALIPIGSWPHPIGTAGGTGTGEPGPPGDGSLSLDQGLQTIPNDVLTTLTGLSLKASSTYLGVFVSSLTTGMQAIATFETSAAAAVVTASFQVPLGCNLQDPDDLPNFSIIFPGMGLNSGAIAFRQKSGAPMNIRWVAQRGAAV